MRDQVLAWLVDNRSRSRLQHILGVEQTAALLATDRALDVEQAAAAGLMHDLAQNFTLQPLWEIAAAGWEIDRVKRSPPHPSLPQIGAILARDRLGVQDEEILPAIENHTFGRAGMSRIGCIMFVADSIDPGRGNCSELEELQLVSRENLARAVWETCNYSITGYLMAINRLIHLRMILMRNWATQMASRNRRSAQDNNLIVA